MRKPLPPEAFEQFREGDLLVVRYKTTVGRNGETKENTVVGIYRPRGPYNRTDLILDVVIDMCLNENNCFGRGTFSCYRKDSSWMGNLIPLVVQRLKTKEELEKMLEP